MRLVAFGCRQLTNHKMPWKDDLKSIKPQNISKQQTHLQPSNIHFGALPNPPKLRLEPKKLNIWIYIENS